MGGWLMVGGYDANYVVGSACRREYALVGVAVEVVVDVLCVERTDYGDFAVIVSDHEFPDCLLSGEDVEYL